MGLTVRFALGFLAAILCWDALAVARNTNPKIDDFSLSARGARWRGTLVNKVRMSPSSIDWKNTRITVDEAWLEKGKQGGYYLCFIVKGLEDSPLNPNSGFFVLGDSRGSTKIYGGKDWMLCVEYLDSPDLSDVRFSLVGNWKEQRLKNIRFIPQGKAGNAFHKCLLSRSRG
jgi:hypothetical protein